MQVFDCCQGVLAGLDSGKAIRKIWNNLKDNAFKRWVCLSAGFPTWGDKLPIKHEKAIAITSLRNQPVCTVHIRFFVALNRSTGILHFLCNLDFNVCETFLLMKCLFQNNTAFQTMLSFVIFLTDRPFKFAITTNRSNST